MSKQDQLNSHPTTHITPTTSDLWTSHEILAPNEFSPFVIGIHNLLVPCSENEYFGRSLYQAVKMGLEPKYFIARLIDMEKALKKERQVDSEKAATIARLKKYLDENALLFENILKEIQNHVKSCVQEDLPLLVSQPSREFNEQCLQLNEAALKRHRAHRRQRFQVYDDIDGEGLKNAVTLQKWIFVHFQVFLHNMKPHAPIYGYSIRDIDTLLNNSFFIIQQPSPPIATHSQLKNEGVTAKINSKILCLLDPSDPAIAVQNIIPIVHRIKTSNQIEESDMVYQQSPINWKTYSIKTASNAQRKFFASELSSIVLEENPAALQNQKSSTKKIHYAKSVYYIDFHINVTVRFPHYSTPYKGHVIVRSSPFGLVTNTAQAADLFAEVFIEDLKSCKQISTVALNNINSLSPTTDLTFSEIRDGIRRYFIYKTGIYPKHWVLLSIEKQLAPVYNNNRNSTNEQFNSLLAKILAQIDFMAEHPLLILFHEDGLFAFNNTDPMDQLLKKLCDLYGRPICAIRFGSIYRMRTSNDVRLCVDFVDKRSGDIKRYRFVEDKLSSELGSFIVRIALCQASSQENVLSDISTSDGINYQCVLTNMYNFAKLYDSVKLREFCPPEDRYRSIWTSFEEKKNNTSTDGDTSQLFTSNQNLEMTPHIPPSVANCMPEDFMDTPQSSAVFSDASGINQGYVNSIPLVIVITSPNQFPVSNEDITQLISNYLPQYSPFIPSDHIHRFHVDPSSHSLVRTPENLLTNQQSISISCESYTTDPMNLEFIDEHF